MKLHYSMILFLFIICSLDAQDRHDPKFLTIDRIYASNEFNQAYQSPITWIEDGEAYIMIERNEDGQNELIKYTTLSQEKSIFVSSAQLTPNQKKAPIYIEDFSLSNDESKVLIFTNSRRVWRSNTKGDYWVYDLTTNKLSQIGAKFPSSSLMFAKFSDDNNFVAYVMEFNLYKEHFSTGEVTQLTTDGTKDIINGTFDWVYEEEFGCRDGFRWSPDATKIAYWQLDASKIKLFNMINNTNDVYSQVTPVQYPKVGEDPSSARIGIVNTRTAKTEWVKLEGSIVQNYIPGIQWANDDLLLIQQLNRKQNHLKIWAYKPSSKSINLIYEEREETWVDIRYPGEFAPWFDDNDLYMSDENSFLRMVEDEWRNAYKIDITTGKSSLVSPGNYDVAQIAGTAKNTLYYIASPDNSTQRYLYSVDLNGSKKDKRITPEQFEGVNTYNISPNGKYGIHTHTSALKANSSNLISLPDHQIIKPLVSNEDFAKKIATLDLPSVEFFAVNTDEGVEIDGRMIKPSNFDPSKKYPVIFHVYGESWGQVATDSWIGLWEVMMVQKGYIIIDIDNRGTPCLKGSEWRKSIYRNIGQINIKDLGMAASEIVRFPYIDEERVGVWGWSGGGTSTLNLMFQYPDVFKTGVAVASVANQLTYDNIYQERYMGLPQENKEDFIAGSPITHAKNLEGNLLLIHGTADDNVHYQNMELIVNELILQNKQFSMMSYPNRSHGIYEGKNTSRHLYTLITNYFLEHVPIK
ncbi:MAG: S9 family peptidase [Chitinophagales bacterium]|nr:S9 family peptidase [Chitinophagales bacterium]